MILKCQEDWPRKAKLVLEERAPQVGDEKSSSGAHSQLFRASKVKSVSAWILRRNGFSSWIHGIPRDQLRNSLFGHKRSRDRLFKKFTYFRPSFHPCPASFAS